MDSTIWPSRRRTLRQHGSTDINLQPKYGLNTARNHGRISILHVHHALMSTIALSCEYRCI
eukprot:6197579-Pleurochrysis_carterae.AAC.3